MKGISKNFKYYFHLFSIILFLVFLISCDGFTPTAYTITATSGPGGSISPSGEVIVTEGESQEFTITPDECHQIAEVLVDGVSQGSITTYTFTDIQEDHTIQANFVVPGPRVYNTTTDVTYTTIQEAIDASHTGDTIVVCPGTYYEHLIFNNKNITLRSTEPTNPSVVSATIIDGGGSDSVVIFTGGDTSTLEGFKITNGNAIVGGGIYVSSSSPTITNNTITGNTADEGGGIILDSSSATIISNNITANSAGSVGGGIFAHNGNPVIKNNYITDNTATSSGGGILLDGSSPEIVGNNISDNLARSGGGIVMGSFSSPHISDNSITNNTATLFGGGIVMAYHCFPLITNNIIQENVATGPGGGICIINESSPIVEDNVIVENKSQDSGGGIYVSLDSNLLPASSRPAGWGTSRENIPTGITLVPAEGVEFTIAGNNFVGNEHGAPLDYTAGAHVYFQ
jgi:parallel beta-helix repeat protein